MTAQFLHEYTFVAGLDSSGHDIGKLGEGLTIEEMKAVADATPDCVAFNTNGWFKSALRASARWTRWSEDPHQGMYIKELPPRRVSAFELVPHMDSSGNDIRKLRAGMPIDEIEAAAEAEPDCVAFNSNGWLKRALRPRHEWVRWTGEPGLGLYVRKAAAQLYGYDFVPHVDSAGNDIGNLGAGMSLGEMKALADADPDCAGFNSNGWFKRTIRPPTELVRWTDDPGLGLYVKHRTAATLDLPDAVVGAIRAAADEMAAVAPSLGQGHALDPPVQLPGEPVSELFRSGRLPHYDLYTRLQRAASGNELRLTSDLLGPYSIVAAAAGALVDVLVPIRNVSVEFARGEPGMVGVPGAELAIDPEEDGTLATPEDHAVKISGDVTLLGMQGVEVSYADFFFYKGAPHAAVRFVFPEGFGVGALLPGMPLVSGLRLASPVVIVATCSTLYDPALDSGIEEGFNFFGGLQIAESPDPVWRFLGWLLGVEELFVHGAAAIEDGTPRCKLEAAMRHDIVLIDRASFGLRLTRTDVAVEIAGRPAEPSVSASLDVVVTLRSGGADTHLVFTGGVELEAESITASLTMNGTGRSPEGALTGTVQNTGEWREPFGILGITVRQLAAQIGFTYAPPWIDNVGVHGDLSIAGRDGSISVLVDANDADEFVLAGTLDKITILELASALSPATFAAFHALPSGLRNTLDRAVDVALEDVKVNIVPTATSIGGVHFRDEGVTVMGSLVAWGWRGNAFVNVDAYDGVSARVDLDPLDFAGVLRIEGAWGEPAPLLRMRLGPHPPAEMHISGRAVLLGLGLWVEIEADPGGLAFDFRQSHLGLVTTDLRVALAGDGFAAAGTVEFMLRLSVPTPFGHVRIVDAGFAAETTIEAGSAGGFHATVAGSFELFGASVKFPTLTLATAPADFDELYDLVVEQIRLDALELLAAVFATLEVWAEAVADGVIYFAGEVADVAKYTYQATAEAAAAAYRTLGKTADDAARGLKTAYGATVEVAAAALEAAEYAAVEVADALGDTFEAGAQATGEAMVAAGYQPEEVGRAIVGFGSDVTGDPEGTVRRIRRWLGI